MDPREMFNEIYGIAPDDGHGDGDDGEGYTMAFGTEMLEEEAEESTPAPTQRKSKRKRGAISSEPSAEVDIGYEIKDGKIIIGEGDQWLEILGCGMVHPNVLKNVKVDPSKFQGYAFGIGIDRLAMLKYGINDLRAFFDCDYRWLNHFGFDPLDVPTNYRGLSR